ncbi:succinate dehydrogenase, hydrophobic membrane anchor protein [Parasalinivibrio latis]|uniref:succinate dehydrogenase, hydrophobic membrane anchor protein n=1 Tax=Parasalinivibrio latis TaxID=2952610 RepID=UPI0030DFE546
MVGQASSLGRNGIHDWLLIRASGIIIALYTLYIVGYFAFGADVNYLNWTAFFGQLSTKVFTMLALVCVLIHAWIGLWQVLTDYIKSSSLRMILQFGIVAVLFVYFFSGLFILWGV